LRKNSLGELHAKLKLMMFPVNEERGKFPVERTGIDIIIIFYLDKHLKLTSKGFRKKCNY
jgi:hypothetical protein